MSEEEGNVEQLELVRRLRESGLSLADIAQMYTWLERSESMAEASAAEKRPPSTPSSSLDAPPLKKCPPATEPSSSQTPTPVLLSHLLGPVKELQGWPPLRPPPLVEAAPSQRTRSPFPFSHLLTPEPSAYRPLRADMDFSMTKHPAELSALLANGEEAAIGEMKRFVGQHQLRQTAVAAMSGVSQPYISKFLNGNYKELSQRVRTILFSWFVGARADPDSLVTSTVGRTFGEGGQSLADLLPQRRERYVFRPSLIRIMEAHFAQHAYPDLERRMEIAAECNRTLKFEKQDNLMSKELVSPQVIANWFANKRKEFKRKIVEVEGGEGGKGNGAEGEPEKMNGEDLKVLQSELAAVSSSVLALINPYGDEDVQYS